MRSFLLFVRWLDYQRRGGEIVDLYPPASIKYIGGRIR